MLGYRRFKVWRGSHQMWRPNDEHVTAPVERTIDAVVKSVRHELQSDGGMGDPASAPRRE